VKGGLLAAGLLAGCAGVTPLPPVPPLSYPPSAAERVIRIAMEEWRDWGSLIRPAFAEGSHGNPEGDADSFPRVLAYWRAVPEDGDAIATNRRRYEELLHTGESTLWADPAWSAAFISFVFRNAGVDAPEFPYNAAHVLYLDGMTATARAWPDRAPFLPRSPRDYAPRQGDLVCRDRSRTPLLDWAERQAEAGVFRPMHCDIVVSTAPGVVRAVGGNVGDAVTMVVFETDGPGHLLPAPPGRAPIVVIMQSRLGRLPPWGNQQ